MKLSLSIILLFNIVCQIAMGQVPYEFESPNHRQEERTRSLLIKGNVKQINVFVTQYDEKGAIKSKRITSILKYNQNGTICIAEFINIDSTKLIQITEHKSDTIYVTDIQKNKSDSTISSNTLKKDKYGKLIRNDVIFKWTTDTISSETISYTRTKLKLNGIKGISTEYLVNKNGDSLTVNTIEPDGDISGTWKYYFDSNNNLTKEVRESNQGTVYYKYDLNDNLIEELEYNSEILRKKRLMKYNNNNLEIETKIYLANDSLFQLIEYEYFYF